MSQTTSIPLISVRASSRLAGASYLDVLSRPGHFLATSAVWIAISVAVSLGAAELIGPLPASGQPRPDQLAAGFLHLLAQTLLLIGFCLMWQRLVIAASVPLKATYAQAMPRYFAYDLVAVLVIILAAIALVIPLVFLAKSKEQLLEFAAFVPLVTYLISLFFFSRLSLAFGGAAAGDHEMSLRGSWRRLRGSTVAIFTGLLILIIPTSVLTLAAAYISESPALLENFPARIAFEVLAGVLSYLSTAIGCTYASRLYLKAVTAAG